MNLDTRTSRRPADTPEKFTIYCHTNRITGKRYVGQTRFTMKRRWTEHVKVARTKRMVVYRFFHAAIRKYGPESFDHEVIEVVTSQDVADRSEQEWIVRLGTLAPNGYNLRLGKSHGHRTRQKMSESAKRRHAQMSEEERSTRNLALLRGVTSYNASQTPEERSHRQKKRWQSMDEATRQRLLTNLAEGRDALLARRRSDVGSIG